MFGKFHRYNTRNREYVQSVGNDDLIVVKTNSQEIAITNRTDTARPRQDPESLVLNGLRGWWRLDEGTSNVVNDSSGYGSHAIIPSGVTWTDGVIGRTIASTNPAANRINLDNSASNFQFVSLNSFSVTCWFRITNNINNLQPMLTIKEDDTNSNKHLHVLKRTSVSPFPNKVTFAFNSANDLNSTTIINDNKWYHFAGTFNYNSTSNTGTKILYINGIQEAIDATPVSPLNFTPINMAIGYSSFSGTCIDGSINDLRIYDRTLTASEVTTIYNLGADDISKVISSNVATTPRNTSSLIYKETGFVNSLGLINSDGTGISAQLPTRSDRLVGWWPLDEGNGLYAFDRAGRNLTATGNAAITWATDNYIGTAFTITPTANRYMQTANVVSDTGLGITNAFTVCCWAKSAVASWAEFGLFFTNRIPSVTNMTFLLGTVQSSTKIRLDSASGATNYFVESASVQDITVWNHYTGTFDGSALRIYVNGQLSNTSAMTASLSSVNSPINIGRDNTQNRILNGSITDCRIYNATLGPNDIQAIMQERRPLDAPRDISKNLVAWWQINEGSGSFIPDYTGNNFRLQLLLNPTWVFSGPNNNRCLRFDSSKSQYGITQSISLTTDYGITNKFSVSVWIKSTQSTWNVDGAGVSHRNTLGNYTFIMHPNSGQKNMSFFVFVSASGKEAKVSVSDITQWHHYVGVYNGSYVKIYLDGVLGATTAASGSVITTAIQMRVGGDYLSVNRYLNGEISDVRIYNTDLSDLEVANLFQETVGNYKPLPIQVSKNNYITSDNKPELLLQLTGASSGNSTFVLDYSGYQHHANIAVASGVTYSSVNPIIGTNSLSFNGTTGYLVCDGINNGQTFSGICGISPRSISMWVNPISLATNRPLLSYGANSNRSFYDLFIDTTGNINLSLDNSDASYIYKWNTQLVTGAWQHITLTQESDGTLACYKGTVANQPTTSNLVSITDGLDTSNLLVWLPLTDGQGTIAYDYSAITNTSNATLVNATFLSTGGKFGTGSVSLNGTTANITTTFLPNIAQPFTWSMWVNTSNTTNYQPLIGLGNNNATWESGEFIYTIRPGGNLSIEQNGIFIFPISNALVYTNTWTHTALVSNGTTKFDFYINGVFSNTVITSAAARALGATSNTATIGRSAYTGGPFFFNGNIADVRLYNSNLSANSIAAIYNNSNRINTFSNNNLQIGRGVPGSPYVSNYYSGNIDDVRFYSGTLSIEDVNNIYSSNSYSFSNSGIVLPSIPTSRNKIYNMTYANTTIYNYAPGNQNNASYFGISTNAAPYHIKNGLMGWWKLDEQTGTIFYNSNTSGANGIIGGSQTSNSNIGPYNNSALNLTGAANVTIYNTSNFPFTGSNLSYSAWFRCSNVSSNNTIIGLNTSTAGGNRLPAIIYNQSNTVSLAVYNGSTQITTTTSNLPINSWNHLTVTATSGDSTANIRVYLNAQLFATSTTTITCATTDRLFLGGISKTAGFGDYFYGQISDVRLYNRKITDNEIKLLYNSSPSFTTQTYTGIHAIDIFGSNLSATDYSRRIEQTGNVNSNTLSIACWVEPLYIGTHTIASSKSTGVRGNGDWQFQLVSPGYDALKGWYLLNEGTGTSAYDCGPNFYHGTISGAIDWDDALKSIKALTFNGSSTYVQLDSGLGSGLASSLTSATSYTFSMWFYMSSGSGSRVLFAINDNSATTNKFIIYLNGQTMTLITNGTIRSTSRIFNITMWHFVCVVINADTYTVYHNSSNSYYSVTDNNLTVSSNDKITVGAKLTSTNDYFAGDINDVRVWDRALTRPEISDVFQSNHYLYGSMRIGGTNYPIYDTRPIELESWRHVGFQYTAAPGELKLFLDGQISKKSTLTVGNQPANLTSNTVIGALSVNGALNQFSHARISDYRQYNYFIPESEYYKYATGYYEQAFKLDITPPINTSNLASGLVDSGTKWMGKEESAIIQVNGEPRIQQMTSNVICDKGYEVYFDGINDYLSLPNSHLQNSYNRIYSITGWVKPDTISLQSNVASMPLTTGGIYDSCAVLNNNIYVFGGFDGTNMLTAIRRFDGTSWFTETATLSTARREIACATYKSNIYLIGGWTNTPSSTYFNTVQRYNGSTLTTLNNFSLSVSSGMAVVYNDRLYYIGGEISGSKTGAIYVYNDADSWTLVTNLNISRGYISAAVYNGLVYVIGGNNGTTDLTSVEVFDGSTCRYTYSLNATRRLHTSASLNGYLYIFGGIVGGTRSSNIIERFDGRTWTTLSQTLLTGRDFHGTGVIYGKCYIFGGVRAAGATYSALNEHFKPSASVFSKATNDFSCYNLSWENMSNSYVFDMGIGNEKVFISSNALSNYYSHLAIVNTGIDGFLGMYLNGSLMASTYLSSAFNKGLQNVSTTIIPMIGYKQDDESSYFQGAITDLRFWEKPLTQPEITNLVRPISTTLQITNQVSAETKYPELNLGLIFWISGEEIRGANGNKITERSDYKRRCVNSSVTAGSGRLPTTTAMYFNGSSRITIPPSSLYALKQSALTVSFWVKFGSSSIPASNEFIFYLWGAATANNYFEILRATSTGELRGTFNDSGDTTNALKISDTNWHHFVLTYNGGTTTGTRYHYLDGNIFATGTAKTSLTFSTLPSVAFIGSSGASSFTGFLEDFRIYNRALSIDEVRYIYNSTNNSTTYNLATQQIPYAPKTYLTKYTYDNKGRVINVPLPEIARDNLICHYDFKELDANSNVKDMNWESKPLANYRNSSYLTNKTTITIPYNPGKLNGDATITGSGLSMSGAATSNLTLTPIFDDGKDWSLSFQVQTTNSSAANVNLWSYTATSSSANNKLLFVNSSNGGEVVFQVGTSTEYNTGLYVTDNKPIYLGVTKGTIGNQTDMVSFYQNGLLTTRRNITLTNDGPSIITLGPFSGIIQDYRMYSTQLNSGQLQILASRTNDTLGIGAQCGPKHMWRIDEQNTSTTIIRDLGTEGTNLVLSNITVRTKASDLNAANSAVSCGSLFFNGTNSSAQAFSAGVLRDNCRTITFWMKLSSNAAPASDQKLVDYGDFATSSFGFAINRESANSKISVTIHTTGGKVTSTSAINNTSWNHIGIVVLPKDNSTSGGLGTMRNLLIYINGVDNTDTSTWNAGIINTTKSTSPTADWITIGKNSNTIANFFGGFMDDIRVYDVALTPQEIRAIYSNSTNYNFIS